ncbi:hypothetical protein LCGC14_0973040 [marine sediment metagenome]|uniref:peptide chain release factor N(5)-glutamine methyltransferase n=1 Tax=marine sediment metagenome TaxID=412755 RepID=A0A0F9NFG4_9ZZZZ
MNITINLTKTIKQILDDGARYLQSKGNNSARTDAESLVAHSLGLKRVDIYLQLEKTLIDDELIELRELFKLRATGKPLQYILGTVAFRYLEIAVDENVLIPRPETEIIVEVIADIVTEKSKVLELGTGSGAIALSVASEVKARVDATDICTKALSVARSNAQKNGVSGVNFFESDWFSSVSEKYDLIVVNPPYVSLDEYSILQTEIRDFEPRLAVTDEADGLRCIKMITDSALSHLTDNGYLVLEIGHEQRKKVKHILDEKGFKNISAKQDLANRDRFVVASA